MICASRRAVRRWGGRWGFTELHDIASLPLFVVALTLFFYLTALVATSSRGILGDGPPAPVPGTERALEVPPPPESIVGTAAGDAWTIGVQKFR